MSDAVPHPRDDCHLCGDSGELETHHIFPRRYGGSDEESNLVDVCSGCHDKLETLYDDRHFEEKCNLSPGEHRPIWGKGDRDICLIGIDEEDLSKCPVCLRRLSPESIVLQPEGKKTTRCRGCDVIFIQWPGMNETDAKIVSGGVEFYD